MKSKVFTLAHAIRHHFTNFSQSLKAAWMIVKLTLGRPVNITFAKSTGEVREARAIAVSSLESIKKGFVRFVEMLDNGHTQWRSFRLERLIF